MKGVIAARTLTDGGQSALEIAAEIAAFLGEARTSLDFALYHLELGPETAAIVGGAIRDAAARGVAVRIVYNLEFANPIPVPPPPNTDDDLILSLGVPSRSIAGIPDLMHHKFVVRDGDTVWTGSLNWTDDSWTRQENVIVTVRSEELAYAFTLAFEQLWEHGDVARSGRVEPRRVEVGDALVRPWFTPKYGDDLSHRISKYLGRAKTRVRIASPVLTAGPILGTLAELDGVDTAGVVDITQTLEVLHQWETNGVSGWKVPILESILRRFPWSGKRSTPWTPDTLHDFMHAKVVIADDVVFVGSFNHSRSGESNAENVLEIHDSALADRLAAYVDEIRARYPAVELGRSPTPIR